MKGRKPFRGHLLIRRSFYDGRHRIQPSGTFNEQVCSLEPIGGQFQMLCASTDDRNSRDPHQQGQCSFRSQDSLGSFEWSLDSLAYELRSASGKVSL